MSAKSPHSPSTPRSSSPLDGSDVPNVSAAVQELLELRREKEKYRELQALLRQGLENLKKHQEAADDVLVEYQQALKDIANISTLADMYFDKVFATYNKYIARLRTPYTLNMKKRERLAYVDDKYEEYLGENIKHHEEAISILRMALDEIQDGKQTEAYSSIAKAAQTAQNQSDKTDIEDISGQ